MVVTSYQRGLRRMAPHRTKDIKAAVAQPLTRRLITAAQALGTDKLDPAG